jgi:hypothetical protein
MSGNKCETDRPSTAIMFFYDPIQRLRAQSTHILNEIPSSCRLISLFLYIYICVCVCILSRSVMGSYRVSLSLVLHFAPPRRVRVYSIIRRRAHVPTRSLFAPLITTIGICVLFPVPLIFGKPRCSGAIHDQLRNASSPRVPLGRGHIATNL